MNAPLNILAALDSYGVKAVIENGRVRLVCPNDNPPPAELIEAARAHKGELHQLLVTQEARCDRFEERAAILEFDEGLSRAEAEAIARREMMAGVYDDMQAPRDAVSYASGLAALRANCPAHVPGRSLAPSNRRRHGVHPQMGHTSPGVRLDRARPVWPTGCAGQAPGKLPTSIPIRSDRIGVAVEGPAGYRAD